MRLQERWDYLKQAHTLSWDILFRGLYDFTYDLMPVRIVHMSLRKRVNLLRAGGNLIRLRAHPWSWPLHIHIELTNYCNIRCNVCPTGIGRLHRRSAAMDPALLESLMDQVGSYLLTASLWGWGESLLHPQLDKVLSKVQNRGITTFLSTNGQNLNDENVLRALVDYPPTYLLVCLDGLTDETISVFRKGATLEPALSGVRRLVEMRNERGSQLPVIHFRYIVMRHNEHEVPQIPQFAAQNHFDELSIRTLSIIDAPDDIHREIIPENKDYRAYDYDGNECVRRDDFVCEKAFTFPAVYADGTVVSCEQDFNAQKPYGSLADGSSFADIWWSSTATSIRRTIRDNPDEYSFCRNCPFRNRPISTCSIQYLDLRAGVGSSRV